MYPFQPKGCHPHALFGVFKSWHGEVLSGRVAPKILRSFVVACCVWTMLKMISSGAA